MWGVNAGVQVSRREIHTHMHLDYARVEILSCKKKIKIKSCQKEIWTRLYLKLATKKLSWQKKMEKKDLLTLSTNLKLATKKLSWHRGGNSCSQVGFMSCRAMSIWLYRLTRTRPV